MARHINYTKKLRFGAEDWMHEAITDVSNNLRLSTAEYIRELIKEDLAKYGYVEPRRVIKKGD